VTSEVDVHRIVANTQRAGTQGMQGSGHSQYPLGCEFA
jgi:hypothetical protein